jgi:DNA polymerase-3 subunit epsilon
VILFFDTETTGLPDFRAPSSDPRQPHLVQLAAILATGPDEEVETLDVIIRPDDWTIPDAAAAIHSITTERALAEGIPLASAVELFNAMLGRAELLVAHNIGFDEKMMRIAYHRAGLMPSRENMAKVCTMKESTLVVNLPPTDRMLAAGFNKPKSPNLGECIRHFFSEDLDGAHNALIDVRACARVFFRLRANAAKTEETIP